MVSDGLLFPWNLSVSRVRESSEEPLSEENWRLHNGGEGMEDERYKLKAAIE